MSIVTAALLLAAPLCRPADLLCPTLVSADEFAFAEVPSFLPETSQCWMDGHCPSDRITLQMVEQYARAAHADLRDVRIPDATARHLRRHVEDYHHACNREIRGTFAQAFSRGDFEPTLRHDYHLKTIRFFKSAAGQTLTQSRRGMSPAQAAAAYDLSPQRIGGANRTKAIARFLSSEAGQWWQAARVAAWSIVRSNGVEPNELCPSATDAFDSIRIGVLSKTGLTEPIRYRAFSPRRGPPRAAPTSGQPNDN